MSARLRVVDVTLGVELRLFPEPFEARFGLTPETVGASLADQVSAHVWGSRLGYFPPLDYFHDSEAVDQQLLTVAIEMAAFAEEWVRVEVRRRVTHAFSRLAVRAAHAVALTMPHVRPRQPDTQARLARHYTPDTVRAELLASSLEKGDYAGVERMAAIKVSRWLGDGVREVQIPLSRLVEHGEA